ncbi:MAG TPA: GNAT family N-acetyltransferase [Ktedonobacterales bacterium]|nr:GNAT family N-acetyltransferase [Ktedonobacterales bacterium]
MRQSRSPRELLSVQLTLQCVGIEAGNLFVRIPGPDPDGIPRYYVARFPDDTYDVFFARDVPRAVRERLAALAPHIAFENPAAIERILASDAPCAGIWMGTSYTFPNPATPADFPDVIRLSANEHAQVAAHYDADLVLDGRAAFAIMRDGQIVASCVSSRENATAGEAWVRTEEAYRGRGYARQVTAAWGTALRLGGKVAFYSHRSDNAASTGVARSLGLQPFARDVGYL